MGGQETEPHPQAESADQPGQRVGTHIPLQPVLKVVRLTPASRSASSEEARDSSAMSRARPFTSSAPSAPRRCNEAARAARSARNALSSR